jgi:hypothetical protein
MRRSGRICPEVAGVADQAGAAGVAGCRFDELQTGNPRGIIISGLQSASSGLSYY